MNMQNCSDHASRLASKLLDGTGWIFGDDAMRRNAVGQVPSLELLDDSHNPIRVMV